MARFKVAVARETIADDPAELDLGIGSSNQQAGGDNLRLMELRRRIAISGRRKLQHRRSLC
jgi:hypothetical protein